MFYLSLWYFLSIIVIKFSFQIKLKEMNIGKYYIFLCFTYFLPLSEITEFMKVWLNYICSTN